MESSATYRRLDDGTIVFRLEDGTKILQHPEDMPERLGAEGRVNTIISDVAMIPAYSADPHEHSYRSDCPLCAGVAQFKFTVRPLEGRYLWWCRSCGRRDDGTYRPGIDYHPLLNLVDAKIPRFTFLTEFGFRFPGQLFFRNKTEKVKGLVLTTLEKAYDSDVLWMDRQELERTVSEKCETSGRTFRRALTQLIQSNVVDFGQDNYKGKFYSAMVGFTPDAKLHLGLSVDVNQLELVCQQ